MTDPRSPLIAVRRVVVTGSECTGKTTLSGQLAEELSALWVPEYARTYAEQLTRPLEAWDVEPIARGQIDSVDLALAEGPSALVMDTDLVSTVVYARHYYGSCPDWIVSEARSRLAQLYLLCDTDIPWIADGVRDQPQARQRLQEAFRDLLDEFKATVVPISGLGSHRLQQAVRAVRATSGWA